MRKRERILVESGLSASALKRIVEKFKSHNKRENGKRGRARSL